VAVRVRHGFAFAIISGVGRCARNDHSKTGECDTVSVSLSFSRDTTESRCDHRLYVGMKQTAMRAPGHTEGHRPQSLALGAESSTTMRAPVRRPRTQSAAPRRHRIA